MNISYRAAVASAAPEPEATLVQEPRPRLLKLGKVARLSCCCKLSELMPLVRQLHDEARARRPEATPARAA